MGEAIRQLRERQGWSLDELAGRIEMSRTALSRREVGDTRVKANEYKLFADVFGVTERELKAMARAGAKGQDLEGDDGRIQSADLLQIFVGPLGSAVVRIFANNSPMDARLLMDRLIAYAEGLADTPRTQQGGRMIDVHHPPEQRDGYVEEKTTTYEDRRDVPDGDDKAQQGRRSAGA